MWQFGILALVLWCSGTAYAESSVGQRMNEVYEALAVVYPLAVEPGKISQPRYHKQLTDGLETIAGQMESLRSHMGAANEKFDFNSYTLESIALQASEHYRNKQYDEAAYDIRRMTETCVNCHSRQPAGTGKKKFHALSDRLLGADQPPQERARLMVATRQFDDARKLLEKEIRGQNYRYYEFTRDSALLDYLILQVRVLSQPAQAKSLLDDLMKKPELPVYMVEYLKAWSQSLDRIAKDKRLHAATIVAAQRNIEAAEELTLYKFDRTALVHYLQASRVLEMAIGGGKLSRDETAEAYWLLGTMEVLVGRNFWLSSAASYLEAAIRTAPKSQAARQAYRMLEEHIIIYAFSVRPEFLPTDTFHAKLEDLRKLMQGAS